MGAKRASKNRSSASAFVSQPLDDVCVQRGPRWPLKTEASWAGVPIHLVRLANDLVVAGPRSGADGPPWGDGRGPPVAGECDAVDAHRTGHPARAVVADQDT